MSTEPRLDHSQDGRGVRLRPAGAWTIDRAARLDRLAAAVPAAPGPVTIDLSAVTALDTAGVLALEGIARQVGSTGGDPAAGHHAAVVGASAPHAALVEAVTAAMRCERVPRLRRRPMLQLVERTGRGAVGAGRAALALLSFYGEVCFVALRTLRHPSRIRLTAFASHLEQTGIDALPILGLLSFLIGVVVTFQGAEQLRTFGAQILVVDLLGISVVRELGILLTAILVAGRSGSAFTAQIGAMAVNQEIDAMRTMGLNPVEMLVLPRMGALMLALPLLSFFACVMALLGGAVVCWLTLDISPGTFLRQLQASMDTRHLFAGLVKAPVFAFAIALVGCFQGLKVGGSAESVGRQTTRSVVQAIFLVIVIDAIFAIVFQMMGI